MQLPGFIKDKIVSIISSNKEEIETAIAESLQESGDKVIIGVVKDNKLVVGIFHREKVDINYKEGCLDRFIGIDDLIKSSI